MVGVKPYTLFLQCRSGLGSDKPALLLAHSTLSLFVLVTSKSYALNRGSASSCVDTVARGSLANKPFERIAECAFRGISQRVCER
jgi:hypothetical protein